MPADFLDTNVFVYLFDNRDARKQAIAARLVGDAVAGASACISFQVVQEALQVLTRKLAVPVTPADAAAFLRDCLQPLWQVQPSTALYERALKLQTTVSLSFYDSLIVAAALEAGCQRLLTEDLQHGQRIEGLWVEDPFRG